MPTAIQWTDETWNPTTGCTKISRGCRHCYIDRTPAFRIAGRKFVRGATDIQLHPDRLEKPLHWRKPRRVFVNSLSDLFHEAVPDEFIARVFQTMHSAPKHTFQVLTKRPERAREWFSRCGNGEGLGWITHDGSAPYGYGGDGIVVGTHKDWPLPNVWVGVSIEDSRVTWRADVLREIPAAVRFISAEPLLGSLYESGARASLDLTGIDWIIVGGESGPGARPFHLEHAREIIAAAYAKSDEEFDSLAPAVFVKQLGAKPIYLDDLTIGVYKEKPLKLSDRKGGDWDEWPADLRVREFPRSAA